MIVKDHPVIVGQVEGSDFINLVQLAGAWTGNAEDAAETVRNWLRNRNTMDFLATWEKMYGAGEDFDEASYLVHAAESTKNSFSISPLKWVETTHAIGIEVKLGRGGGVYAHQDIAMEFCTWLNPVFRLYVVKEFQRLKEVESRRLSQDWNLKRTLAKVNYHLHTDAIKDNIVAHLPSSLQGKNRRFKEVAIYASEADMLSKVVFGLTAAEWRAQNPHAKAKENMRDHATANQLLILLNMENLSATLMDDGHLSQADRFKYLSEKAARQFISLSDNASAKRLTDAMKSLDDAADGRELSSAK